MSFWCSIIKLTLFFRVITVYSSKVIQFQIKMFVHLGKIKPQTAKSPNYACMPQTILKGHHIYDTLFLTLIKKYVPSISWEFLNCTPSTSQSFRLKTQSLIIWETQEKQIYYYKYYSSGVNMNLMKKNGIYIRFCTIQEWCINIILVLDFSIKHNEEGKDIHNEIFNNIPHFTKTRIRVNCLLYGFVMYNDKVLIWKR